MRTFFYCKACYNKIFLKGRYADILDVKEKHGHSIHLFCENCGEEAYYDVQRIDVKIKAYIPIACLLLFPLIGIVLNLFGPFNLGNILSLKILFSCFALLTSLYTSILFVQNKRKKYFFANHVDRIRKHRVRHRKKS